MDGKVVCYYRVSTLKQGVSGLGLEAQRHAVTAYLNGGSWRLVGEFTEVESGKKADRPQLTKAMELCRLTGAVLIVAKMDRLSRNLHFVTSLRGAGVKFRAVDNPDANELSVNILAAVAEAEAKAISQRTKAALDAAKARGVVLGGYREGARKPDGAAGTAAIQAKAASFAASVFPVVSELRGQGLSVRAVAAALDERGISTPRGGKWTGKAVLKVLAR